jgi:hypothetical protein
MSGIFYDPAHRSLRRVHGAPDPEWLLVTHNVHAGVHACRRVLREWLGPEELVRLDWSALEESGRR